jgi:hypothetical protein
MADENTRTMEDFHCEMLELSLRFSSEDMDQTAFLKAAGIENREEYTDEDGDFATAVSFGAREQSTDYHAHMRVRFFKEGEHRIEISYHDSRGEAIEDVKPPYAEDCAQWVGGFFKGDKVAVRISAAYTFDKSFSPVVSLPFPLTSSEKALAGSLVTGLSILFPKEIPESAVIQMGSDDDTMVFFNTKAELNLKEFDLLGELKRLAVSVNSLVKKTGD